MSHDCKVFPQAFEKAMELNLIFFEQGLWWVEYKDGCEKRLFECPFCAEKLKEKENEQKNI